VPAQPASESRNPPLPSVSAPTRRPASFARQRQGELPSPSDEEEYQELTCELQEEQLRNSRVTDVEFDYRIDGTAGEQFPEECTLAGEVFTGRPWHGTTYTWKASALCHKPLYFKDTQLERYGHEWGPVLQPVVSAARFYADVFILPYKAGLRTPNECVYELGHYRPNSCAPYMIEPLGFTLRAGLFEAGAVVGLAAVLP